MTPRTSMLGVLALVVLSAPAAGQPTVDRGRRQLAKLFVEPASHASSATVRVLGDGQEAALGAVVSSDGFIVTKGTELRGTLTCRFADGRTLPAKIVDYHRASDLAMIKVEATRLKEVVFAAEAETDVGMMVAATGPGGEPLAAGIVGGKARKLYGAEAIIVNEGRGKLGIHGHRDAESADGVVVPEIDPGQAADRAGMKPLDRIVAVAGRPVRDRDGFQDAMANRRRGEVIDVKVRRGDREISLDVRLGPYGESDQFTIQQGMGGMLSGRRTGFPEVVSHDAMVRAVDCGGTVVDLDGNVLGLNIARAGRTETWMLPGRLVVPLIPTLKAAKFGDWPGR